jgi:hypothetical protein
VFILLDIGTAKVLVSELAKLRPPTRKPDPTIENAYTCNGRFRHSFGLVSLSLPCLSLVSLVYLVSPLSPCLSVWRSRSPVGPAARRPGPQSLWSLTGGESRPDKKGFQ